MDAVAEIRCVIASHPENLVDELMLVDNPALGPFQDGDLVGFKPSTATKNGFTTINLVCIKAVCHAHLH